MAISDAASAYLTPCPVTPGQAQALERFCRALQASYQGHAAVSPEVAMAALGALGDLARSPGGASASAGWSALRSPTTPQTGTTFLARNVSGDELLLQLDYAGRAHLGSWTLYSAGRMIQHVMVFDLVQRGAGWTLRLNHDGQTTEIPLGPTAPGGLAWTRQPDYPQDRAGAEMPGVSGDAPAFNPAELAWQALGAVASAAVSAASSAPPAPPEPEKAAAATVMHIPPVSSSAKTALMSPPAQVSGKLSVLNGPLTNREFPLGDILRLGREEENDLTLPDEKVSRRHARIERRGAQYQITDLGSSNGTWVNGTRITAPTVLGDGDTLFIGDTQLRFNLQS